MRRLRLSVLAVLFFSAAACGDTSEPAGAPAPNLTGPRASVQQVAARLGPSWQLREATPACFVSLRNPVGHPIAYRYARVKLHLPARVYAEDGALIAYRYRLVRSTGETLRVVNCLIPRTVGAWREMNQRLGVTADASGPVEPGLTLEGGCVATGGVCELEPIIAVGEPGSRLPEEETACTVNICGMGTVGGGSFGEPFTNSGGGPSGGSNECTDCGPGTPTLQCSEAARGAITTCKLADGTNEVPGTGWKFTGSGWSIPGPNGFSAWRGPAVVGGQVEVKQQDNPTTTFQATLTVRPRPWRWGSAQWSYQQGTAYPCYSSIPGGVIIGWNIPLGDATCNSSYHLRVQPDPRFNQSGIVVAEVPTGPNTGMLYVDTVTFRMDRNSNVNVQITSAGTALQLSGWQQSQCGPSANVHAFNLCVGISMASFMAGLWGHEGMGANGGTGHESAARYAAGLRANDPYAGVESYTSNPGEDVTQFRARVGDEAVNRGMNINAYSADGSGNVTGNWSGTLWLWNWNFSMFVSTHQTL